MGISKMKDELHARLWSAQQRWFALKDQGLTKHDLKIQGLRERGDMFYATRGILFTGATRLAYEQDLKRFLDYAYAVRGGDSLRMAGGIIQLRMLRTKGSLHLSLNSGAQMKVAGTLR